MGEYISKPLAFFTGKSTLNIAKTGRALQQMRWLCGVPLTRVEIRRDRTIRPNWFPEG